MLPKQTRRSLCDPFRAHNAGQQGVDDERIGDEAADKAAPYGIVACRIALHGPIGTLNSAQAILAQAEFGTPDAD
jgi:hypothetical protein